MLVDIQSLVIIQLIYANNIINEKGNIDMKHTTETKLF